MSNATTEAKKKQKNTNKVPRWVPDTLKAWQAEQQLKAEAQGLTTKGRRYMFQEINASETVKVAGREIVWGEDKDGNVTVVEFQKAMVEVPKNTPLFPYFERGELVPILLSAEASDKAKVYMKAAMKLWNNNQKYLIGNMKSEDTILVSVSRKQAKDMLGSDLGLYENPFKPWLAAFGTPSRLLYDGKGQTIRIRLVDDLKTSTGIKYHDGNFYARVHMEYKKYMKPDPKLTAEENAARTPDIQEIKLSHQDRMFGEHKGKKYPAVKVKGYNDEWKYYEWCQKAGFNPYETDAIMCLGNIKTKGHGLKHGDILEMPMELFRIIGLSSRSGKSSIGGQAVCLDFDKITALFEEKGMAKRAGLFKKACNGDAAALEEIIQGQEEHSSFEDATIMWIMNAIFAVKRPDGSWGWPRFESNHNNVGVRLNRYFQDNVMKCRMSQVALYIEVDPKLDEAEEEHFKKTGKRVNFVVLPNKSKIKKMMIGHGDTPAEFKYLNIGRNPIVWKGNLQGVEMLRDEHDRPVLNDSSDTVFVSAAFAREMFADQDGDKCIVAPSNLSHFPVFRTKITPEEPKAKGADAELDDVELAKLLVLASMAICDAAMDTGILDYTARQILIEAWIKGKPLTPEQERAMGDLRENAIQRIKHTKGKTAQATLEEDETVKDTMIRLFAVDGAIASSKLAPAEFTITKRHADRRGFPDRVVLCRKLDIINETNFRSGFPFNVAFREIKGATFTIDEYDSDRIKEMFEDGWKRAKARLQQKKAEYGFGIETVVEKGKHIDSYYRGMANAALDLESDRAKQEEFRRIKKVIRNYLENTLKSQFGDYHEQFLSYVTIYLGTLSFGTGKKDGVVYSRSGLALRTFPEMLLIKIGRYVNPESPWAQPDKGTPQYGRAERIIKNLIAKQKQAEDLAREEAGTAHEE